MPDLVVPASVRSIVKLEPGPSGGLVPVEIYRQVRDRKKGTRLLRPIDRAMKRVARAQEAAAVTYLERHERSNLKKRDGWLRDLGNNVYRASTKAGKTLKVRRLLFPD